MKTRIKIEKDKTHEIILTPIEVAIEDIENKVAKIRADMERKDKVMLELQLKSVVASVVNEGPLHIAETFLRLEVREKYEERHRKKLASLFEHLVHETSKTKDSLRSLMRRNEKEKEYFLHLADCFKQFKKDMDFYLSQN